jgi:hypothetical protein
MQNHSRDKHSTGSVIRPLPKNYGGVGQ